MARGGRMRVTREELVAWGERFGAAARPPLVVAISGEVGAGKTTLIQAICRGYGVTAAVTSPTFTLVHEYAVSGRAAAERVYHLDLYRLADTATPPADLLAPLGWEDILDARAVVLVEWPEHAGDRLPPERTTIRLATIPSDPDRRELRLG
jgi:tRNA threonylcarbamoyladenosine biosynthesis protein TsaE